MIDLKAIEKSIDEMIENDKADEMIGWLLKKRMEAFEEFIADDKIELLDGGKECTFTNPITLSIDTNVRVFTHTPLNLALAA